MNIEIQYIKDNGILEKERVVLLVNEDCDLGHYILATSHINNESNTFSSRIEHVYWLPDRNVRKGDKIVVYTKEGLNNQQENDDQTTSHFFYWGMDAPLNSQNNNTCVIIFHASWLVERVPHNDGNESV